MLAEHTSRSSEDDRQLLSASSPRASVAGKVMKRDGKALPNARIAIAGGDTPVPDIAVVSDQEGRFQLNGLAPGHYTLAVISENGTRSDHRFSIADGVRSQSLQVRVPD